MGLFDFVKSQMIEVIEWLDESRDTMVYRFPVGGQEIKMGAKLVVREGQAACFVNKGELADVFGPGIYTLSTDNLPFLTKIMSWKYGFNSPFKAEVYFVTTRQFTSQAWGTQNPVMMRDPEFGYVRLRAFGSYTLQVKDPAVLLKNVVGTAGQFSVDELGIQLRRQVVSTFSQALGKENIAAVDLAGHYEEIGDRLRIKINEKFEEFGVTVPTFIIENISLPKEVEATLDKRSSMGVMGPNLQQYAMFNAAEALGKVGDGGNGGLAGMGAQMAAGVGMGNMMMGMMNPMMMQNGMMGQPMMQNGMMGQPMMQGQMMNNQMAAGAAMGAAAQQPAAAADPMADFKNKVAKLKELKDMGLIDDAEFDAKKKALMAEIGL